MRDAPMRRAGTFAKTVLICLAIGAGVNVALALLLWHVAPLRTAASQPVINARQIGTVTVYLGIGVERMIFVGDGLGLRYLSMQNSGSVRGAFYRLNKRLMASERVTLDRVYMDGVVNQRLKRRTSEDWPGFGPLFSRSMAKRLRLTAGGASAASQTGWPWPALAGDLVFIELAPMHHEQLMDPAVIDRIRAIRDPFAVNGGAYPKRPLLPGFLYNTLLYAAAAYLLIPAFAVRQTRNYCRAKRNVCLRCAYSRAGLPTSDTPCPECGFAT